MSPIALGIFTTTVVVLSSARNSAASPGSKDDDVARSKRATIHRDEARGDQRQLGRNPMYVRGFRCACFVVFARDFTRGRPEAGRFEVADHPSADHVVERADDHAATSRVNALDYTGEGSRIVGADAVDTPTDEVDPAAPAVLRWLAVQIRRNGVHRSTGFLETSARPIP